jgi:hypothetical protein
MVVAAMLALMGVQRSLGGSVRPGRGGTVPRIPYTTEDCVKPRFKRFLVAGSHRRQADHETGARDLMASVLTDGGAVLGADLSAMGLNDLFGDR